MKEQQAEGKIACRHVERLEGKPEEQIRECYGGVEKQTRSSVPGSQ